MNTQSHKKPFVALTCLLDLLFVMVFVALMVQDQQPHDNLQAAEQLISVLEVKNTQQKSELIRTQGEAERLSEKFTDLQRKHEETKVDLEKAKLISQNESKTRHMEVKIDELRAKLTDSARTIAKQEATVLAQRIQIDKLQKTPTSEKKSILQGKWDQYIMSNGRWKKLGRYKVQWDAVTNKTEMLAVSADKEYIQSLGLKVITETESKWVFESDWGHAGVGVFDLSRTPDGTFEGYSRMKKDNRQLARNRWVRVSD